MFAKLFPLTAGALVMGAGSLVIAGILDPIADDLGTSVAVAGQMTAVYAIAFAIAAPVLATVLAWVDRRATLTASLIVFASASAIGALAQSLPLLMASRALAGIAAAAFTPLAIGVGATLVAPEKRGEAISLVFGGFTLAAVFGVPLGTWMGLAVGWRETLLAVAGLGLLAALMTQLNLPPGLKTPVTHLRQWAALAKDGTALLLLTATMFSIAGTYAVYSFIGPYLAGISGLNANYIALMLLVFGAAGVIGNLVSGRLIDRVGAGPTVLANQLGVILALAMLYLEANGALFVALALIVWGATVFSINTAIQARLIAHAPEMQSVLLSANASMLYVGQFMGAAAGGIAIGVNDGGYGLLPAVGASFVILGVVLAFVSGGARWRR
jgi:MFS transporter, DHA1 family, inner membrane transport protein